jgi:predicted lipoprotein with Yx(FWY)xxD motif
MEAMRNRWWGVPVAAGAAALIAACGSSAAPSTGGASTPSTSPQGQSSQPATAAANQITTHSTSKGTVLANSKGKTLYWFAIDTSTKSNCSGECATFWPPVTGKVTAAPGMTLPHGFGTIMRSDGTLQATYLGHPLYTYVGDTGPGQISGNGKNLSGGLWWAMTPSGAKLAAGAAAPAPAGSSSSGGGGYGY